MSIITIIMTESADLATIMIMRSTSIIIMTMTKSAVAMTTIMRSMSITIMTMTESAVATIMKSTITTIMTESAAAATAMSITITMTESVAAAMTITTIMQMKSSQAGAVRQLRNIHVRDLRRSLRHFPSLINTVSFSVQKECFLQRTEHGFILIWFRKKQRSVRERRSIQAVCA